MYIILGPAPWRAALVVSLFLASLFAFYTLHALQPKHINIFSESQRKQQNRQRVAIENPTKVAADGVKALRHRLPGEFIRGMLDSDHPEYELFTFELAATQLVVSENADAEYILGWIAEDRNTEFNDAYSVVRVFEPLHDSLKVGLAENKIAAAHWFEMSSNHGCSAASVALGRLYEYGGEQSPDRMKAAEEFYRKGVAQGDMEAQTLLASLHAFHAKELSFGGNAWNEFENVIAHGNEDESTFAIILAMQAWKDNKISPPQNYSRGAANAYEFALRYDPLMTKNELDSIYLNPGCVPNPNPQFRRDLATKIRVDWH